MITCINVNIVFTILNIFNFVNFEFIILLYLMITVIILAKISKIVHQQKSSRNNRKYSGHHCNLHQVSVYLNSAVILSVSGKRDNSVLSVKQNTR